MQKIIIAAACLAAAPLAPAHALTEPVAQEFIINDVEFDEVAERRVAELLKDRKLVSLPEFFKSLPANRPAISLPTPGDSALDAPEIADKLLTSTLAIGTTSYCKDCETWHVYLSSGFIVAAGGVAATSLHIFQDIEDDVDQTYPIAVDATGRVYPITTLLSADTAADSCLIQLDGAEHLPALPLDPAARTGELVYLMSHPDGRYFRFSDGIIARLVGSEVENRTLKFLDVTAEFAPGSSGGPLVNRHGAVVGHVSTIAAAPLADDGSDADGSAVVERLCTSSSAIADLAEPGVNRRVPMNSPSE